MEAAKTRKCPYCAGQVDAAAKKCVHCGSVLSGPEKKAGAASLLSKGCGWALVVAVVLFIAISLFGTGTFSSWKGFGDGDSQDIVKTVESSDLVKRIDQDTRTIWVDDKQWTDGNRDQQELVALLFGNYFKEKHHLREPEAIVRSHSSDTVLATVYGRKVEFNNASPRQ